MQQEIIKKSSAQWTHFAGVKMSEESKVWNVLFQSEPACLDFMLLEGILTIPTICMECNGQLTQIFAARQEAVEPDLALAFLNIQYSINQN